MLCYRLVLLPGMRFAELGVLSSEISCLNPLRYIAVVFTAAEGAAVEICDFLPYSLFICSLASGWFTSLLCAEEWCGSGLIRITFFLRALFVPLLHVHLAHVSWCPRWLSLLCWSSGLQVFGKDGLFLETCRLQARAAHSGVPALSTTVCFPQADCDR